MDSKWIWSSAKDVFWWRFLLLQMNLLRQGNSHQNTNSYSNVNIAHSIVWNCVGGPIYGTPVNCYNVWERSLRTLLLGVHNADCLGMLTVCSTFTSPNVHQFGREKELELIRSVSGCNFSFSSNPGCLDYHRVRNVSTSFSGHFSASKGCIALTASGSGSTVYTEDGEESTSSRGRSHPYLLPSKRFHPHDLISLRLSRLWILDVFVTQPSITSGRWSTKSYVAEPKPAFSNAIGPRCWPSRVCLTPLVFAAP